MNVCMPGIEVQGFRVWLHVDRSFLGFAVQISYNLNSAQIVRRAKILMVGFGD